MRGIPATQLLSFRGAKRATALSQMAGEAATFLPTMQTPMLADGLNLCFEDMDASTDTATVKL